MFFVKQGGCAFVHPNFNNTPYIEMNEGQHFGMEDLVTGIDKLEDQTNWIQYKSRFRRQFTAQALHGQKELTTTLLLSVMLIYRMKVEFREAYEELYTVSKKRGEKALQIKMQTLTQCGLQKKMQSFGGKVDAAKVKYKITCHDSVSLIPPDESLSSSFCSGHGHGGDEDGPDIACVNIGDNDQENRFKNLQASKKK